MIYAFPKMQHLHMYDRPQSTLNLKLSMNIHVIVT